MAIEVQALVNAGVYPDANTAIQEALRVLWQERPDVRMMLQSTVTALKTCPWPERLRWRASALTA